MAQEEQIVFVDKHGRPTGETGPKEASHHDRTKLHLAFSCYVFNDDGKFLVTQRSKQKRVWPGVWMASLWGHPMPGESVEDAINRKAKAEYGLTLRDLTCILPDYQYKAPMLHGVVEHEFCPVYVARVKGNVKPRADEVESCYWCSWTDYVSQIEHMGSDFSYWAIDQYPKLTSSPAFNLFLESVGRTTK